MPARPFHRAGWTLFTALFVIGCQTPRNHRPGTVSADLAADLAGRPLYTFTEAELGMYLGIAQQTHPNLHQRIVHLARKNIGQPYEIFLLGEYPYEFHDTDPIYCLSKSDCLTFAEHNFAAGLASDWWDYLRILQRIRYRHGVVSMLMRNHYTLADWNRNNAFLFEDMTPKLGDGAAAVPLHQVCRRAKFFAQFGIGRNIPDEPVSDTYIPNDRVPDIVDELHDADFVNIIRGNEHSQHAGHTGLIAIGPDGTANFLHSARPTVREESLVDYLASDRRSLGIKILRLRPDAERIIRHALANSPAATKINEDTLQAAIAKSPLTPYRAAKCMLTGKKLDWAKAMKLQSYRLEHDTPVDTPFQQAIEKIDTQITEELDIDPELRAFGVLDLTDLRLAMIRPDDMFYGASVPKICIALAYFAEHPDAALSIDPQVERELMLMIKRSDNELAAKYSQLVGLDNIQSLLQSKKYRFYDADHGGGFWCGKHYGIETPRQGDPIHDHSHAVTVRQCLRFYLLLEQGKLENAAVSAKLKQIFAAPHLEFHNDRFVRGLNGRGANIIRKSGLWEDWHLDTARIQHGCRTYLLAGMARHPSGGEYLARMAAAVDALICEPADESPGHHVTVHHARATDFHGGTMHRAELAPDDQGVILHCDGTEDYATYTSPILDAPAIYDGKDLPMKFNEVVLSWNLDTPPGCGAWVEARVGRRWDDSWSPWMYFGDWGDHVPAVERVMESDAGKIRVDYFASDERFDRVQYRVRATCATGKTGDVRVRRVVLSLSDLTGIPTATRIHAPTIRKVSEQQWRRRLDVPFATQHVDGRPELAGQACSPVSLTMVLRYHGADVSTEQVVDACFDPTHKIYGNWPRNVQAAYSLGVPAYLRRITDWTTAEHYIALGQPLIISIRFDKDHPMKNCVYDFTDGHLIVIAGFGQNGEVHVNDPAMSNAESGCRVYYRDDLENAWWRGSGGLTYVLMPPQQ